MSGLQIKKKERLKREKIVLEKQLQISFDPDIHVQI